MHRISDRGVSPVIAVILMVAITIILAGLVTIWVFSLVNDDERSSNAYLFNADISAGDRELELSVISGDVFDSGTMKVTIDGVALNVPGNRTMNAGDTLMLSIPASVTLMPQTAYTVKVVIGLRLVWEKEVTAGA